MQLCFILGPGPTVPPIIYRIFAYFHGQLFFLAILQPPAKGLLTRQNWHTKAWQGESRRPYLLL